MAGKGKNRPLRVEGRRANNPDRDEMESFDRSVREKLISVLHLGVATRSSRNAKEDAKGTK